jgi:hypothetical protein
VQGRSVYLLVSLLLVLVSIGPGLTDLVGRGLSTVGYGDVLPTSGSARAAAIVPSRSRGTLGGTPCPISPGDCGVESCGLTTASGASRHAM